MAGQDDSGSMEGIVADSPETSPPWRFKFEGEIMQRVAVSIFAALFVLLAGVVSEGVADYQACREAITDKSWSQAFELCHAEALRVDRGKGGDKRALNAVARLYAQGRGVGRDYSEAMRWYRKAAALGSGRAMSRIGWFYKKGWGVPQDDEAALRWWKKSAEKGNYVGQYNYGFSLVQRVVHRGGAQEDLVTGYMYLILSREQGKGSVRFREERIGYWMGVAERELTYSQLDEARRRARKWRKPSG